VADQLPIVGTTYTMQALVPGGVERCHAQMSAHLPAGVALTPHAPAQSALDELHAENAALKEKLQEQALQALSDDGQWMERTDELRREVERLSLYENLAAEYGLSVFAESAQVIDGLRREVQKLKSALEEIAGNYEECRWTADGLSWIAKEALRTLTDEWTRP